MKSIVKLASRENLALFAEQSLMGLDLMSQTKDLLKQSLLYLLSLQISINDFLIEVVPEPSLK